VKVTCINSGKSSEAVAFKGILLVGGSGGSSTNSIEDRENRDLGSVAH